MRIESIKAGNVYQNYNSKLKDKKPENSYKISPAIIFTGKDRNPNQIAVLATECVPYSVSGGLGSVTRDMTKAYKEFYPNKDLRILLPYYNSLKSFDIEDTGIKTHFRYGVRTSNAQLYKVKKPESGVPAYFVYFPELANLNKEYSLDDYSLFEKYVAFSMASMAILNKMKDSKEEFNPKILHTKDWHTSYAQLIEKDKDLKSVHELLNANSNFHGKINPLAAALNLFSPEQIEKLKANPDFKREIFTLTMNNKNILLKDYYDKGKYNVDVNNLLKDSKEFDSILIKLAQNYPKILYEGKNYYSHIELNNIVMRTFPDINWDENQDFNPTVNAIDKSDAWFTISNAHFHELLEEPYFSSYSLYNMLRLNLNKGSAVLNRIDMDRYNPSDPQQVKYTYNIDSYKIGKQRNKDFLFEQFSKENILNGNFDKKILANPESAAVYGYLDERYKSNPLAVNISRFDTNQKGSDIALDMAKRLLNEDKDINFIFGLPNFKNTNSKMLDKFIAEIVDNPKYAGRVVVIDGYLPINEYLAGADISIIPSRSETCGLVGYQSMRMGAIPVSSPVGSMKDCLITPDMDKENAMGFLTPVHFSKSKNPVDDLTKTMYKALSVYNSDSIDKMIKNCMRYDSGWSKAVKDQNELYSKILSEEPINNLTLNDVSKIKHNLKVLNREDIPNLPKSDVLVCMAHPDDEIFFTPILKYLDEGKSVQIVYCAKGEKGHHKYGAPSTKENLAKHREQEMLNSLSVLGVTRNPVKLNYPDLEVVYKENTKNLYADIDEIIEQVQPQIVLSFGPDGITSNADHKKVGEVAFNLAKINDIPSYQIALTNRDVARFNQLSKKAKTDAFDFITPTDERIVKQFDSKKYREKIEQSLKAHTSQWAPDEAEVLTDFYVNNPAGVTSLSRYPKIKDAKNMWAQRANQFQNKYGAEFKQIDGGVSYKPENENYTINLYIADGGKNKEHMWVESPIFNELYYSPDAVDTLLEKYEDIKQIPQFKDVKYIDLIITNNFGKKFKVVIPENEISLLHGNSSNLCANPATFLENYSKKYKSAKTRMYKVD